MSTEKPILFNDAFARILSSESARLQKTPQDLLSTKNLPSIVWDAATAAIQSLNQRVIAGTATYPEGLITLIEAEAQIAIDQRAAIAQASQVLL